MTKTPVGTPSVLLGSAIGDALGMPFEQMGVKKHPDLANWNGIDFLPGTFHKLPAGRYTDDTEMAMALAWSLVDKGMFSAEDVAEKYLTWFQGSPTGMGGTVRKAMESLQRARAKGTEGAWRYCGQRFDDVDKVGSGTVMRVAPLGVFYAYEPDMLRRVVKEDAYLTHRDRDAFAASLAVASLIAGIIRTGDNRAAAVDFMQNQMMVVEDSLAARAVSKACHKDFIWADEDWFGDNIAGRNGNAWQIASTAIHCALHNWNNFQTGVVAAIKMGGDTDTRAAVVGAILGAVHGSVGIPTVWKTGVKDCETIYALDIKLWNERRGK